MILLRFSLEYIKDKLCLTFYDFSLNRITYTMKYDKIM